MENQVIVLVPSQQKRVLIASEKENREFRWPRQAIEWLENQKEKPTVLGIMGGPGQSLFVRAAQLGLEVRRIPMYRLQEVAGIEPKASALNRAKAILQAWAEQRDAFYPLQELEPDIALVRTLTRVRISIQEVFRKPAQLQFQAAWRDLELLMPEGKELIDLKTFFANPKFIEVAKEDEEELERKVGLLVKKHSLWPYLHPRKDSPLPQIKGLGACLGGSILAEIGDIRRFPSGADLRGYARFGLTKEGQFPHRKKGEVAPWNRYLNRAVWLWSTDQMPRWEHPWRQLYFWKKARELKAHPGVIPSQVKDRQGRQRAVYLFSLKHLDSRAKRWVGSQLLNYLFDLWSVVEQGQDPEVWYPKSSWPAYFEKAEKELAGGLMEYLKAEIPKRRRVQPEEEEAEE